MDEEIETKESFHFKNEDFDFVIRSPRKENESPYQAILRQSDWLHKNSDFWITRIYKENRYETFGVIIAPDHCKYHGLERTSLDMKMLKLFYGDK